MTDAIQSPSDWSPPTAPACHSARFAWIATAPQRLRPRQSPGAHSLMVADRSPRSVNGPNTILTGVGGPSGPAMPHGGAGPSLPPQMFWVRERREEEAGWSRRACSCAVGTSTAAGMCKPQAWDPNERLAPFPRGFATRTVLH